MVSYVAVRSRKTAPVFNVFLSPFSVNVVRAVTWSQVLQPRRKPACSTRTLIRSATVGEILCKMMHSSSL